MAVSREHQGDIPSPSPNQLRRSMIMGDRGTGKSTTVRALVDLLPEMKVVANDPFNSDPEDPEKMSLDTREI